MSFYYLSQSDRIDFLKLMLDAGEEDMQSVGDLSMTLDDKATKENTNPPEKSIPTEEQPKASQKKMKMEVRLQSTNFNLVKAVRRDNKAKRYAKNAQNDKSTIYN